MAMASNGRLNIQYIVVSLPCSTASCLSTKILADLEEAACLARTHVTPFLRSDDWKKGSSTAQSSGGRGLAWSADKILKQESKNVFSSCCCEGCVGSSFLLIDAVIIAPTSPRNTLCSGKWLKFT